MWTVWCVLCYGWLPVHWCIFEVVFSPLFPMALKLKTARQKKQEPFIFASLLFQKWCNTNIQMLFSWHFQWFSFSILTWFSWEMELNSQRKSVISDLASPVLTALFIAWLWFGGQFGVSGLQCVFACMTFFDPLHPFYLVNLFSVFSLLLLACKCLFEVSFFPILTFVHLCSWVPVP